MNTVIYKYVIVLLGSVLTQKGFLEGIAFWIHNRFIVSHYFQRVVHVTFV